MLESRVFAAVAAIGAFGYEIPVFIVGGSNYSVEAGTGKNGVRAESYHPTRDIRQILEQNGFKPIPREHHRSRRGNSR